MPAKVDPTVLQTKPRLLRGPVARGLAKAKGDDRPAIERGGGDFKAGIVRGVAVITRGEALGHRMWIDSPMVAATVDAINAAPAGVKSRFTHPGLSGDGMGKMTGVLKNGWLDDNGNVGRADLHISPAAEKAPDGNLADYTLTLAETHPEKFGLSIAFDPDYAAEDAFVESNSIDGKFASPDPLNANGYPHARLAELRAGDVVDEPAANPNGLFYRGQEIPVEADQLTAWALGLSADPPAAELLGIDPERCRGFIARFLESRQLRIAAIDKPAEPKPVDAAALARQYLDEFGAIGAEWLASGHDLATARVMFLAHLKADNAALAAKVAELTAIATKLRGEDKPLEFTPQPTPANKRVEKYANAVGAKLAIYAAELAEKKGSGVLA